ncbi:MAG TPA: response regulator transcription factor [Bacteroidota bacterium]|nr:response regulator transcription factor [Bacteroidota bacterium]
MGSRTVLLVDDEQDIIDLIKYNLHKEGYNVLTARNGKQALDQVRSQPHIILLDVMMPELDGWEVLRELKKHPRTAEIPVIFLTAKSADIDEVLGLELGADDYIVKPISIPKLLARIKSVLRKRERREQGTESRQPILVGSIEISPAQHRVRVAGKEVFFPKKEFEVLTYLATHLDQVVNRETLLNTIWGTDVRVVDRTVDVHIRKIREKLGMFAEYIETIKGIGYRFQEK